MGDDRGEGERRDVGENVWGCQLIHLINKNTFINILNLVDTILLNHKH